MPDQNQADNVGQAGTYKEVTEKYDAEHGTFKQNVPRDGTVSGLPNANPASPDPSPFKLGPT
jgi:hypothetical protein